MLTVINLSLEFKILLLMSSVQLYKEYVWVLTGHHQTVEHCKNWYLLAFSEYDDSRKQDNRNPNK